MARILLVENLDYWLDLIGRSLPDHEVVNARSYDEALLAIRNGSGFDVAIVDLHLMDSQEHNPRDYLGGRILDMLRDEYPSTLRIALTGYAPGAARKLIDRYDVVDLLLKGNMELAVVSEVVDAALARTLPELAPGVRSHKSAQQAGFRRWQEGRAQRLDQRIVRLRNNIRGSGLMPATADSPAVVAAMEKRLAALESQQEEFGHKCAQIEEMMGRAHSTESVLEVEHEIDSLKRIFGTDGDVPEP